MTGKSLILPVGMGLAARFLSFPIDGYPFLILVNSRGGEVARRFGTTMGGPRDFIAWVESVR